MELDGLELLTEAECRRLLASMHLGRVAIAVGALAVVFPVNYVTAGEDILFWTGEGTKLQAALANQTVTFQVDHLDPATETGWSVLAVGAARERTEPSVLAGATAAGLRSWAGGERGHLIAICAETLSGRRVGPMIDVRGTAGAARTVITPHSPISALAECPLRVDPMLSVAAVTNLMATAGVSCVLVGHDTAVVTHRDLTDAVVSGLDTDTAVNAIGRAESIVVAEDVTVVETAARMLRGELRHVVVCDGHGRVTGLVGIHDLVRILLDAMDPAVWVMLRQIMSSAASLTDR